MLPEFYQTCLRSQLSASQLHTLEILVWLLQFHRQVRIERLAACMPLPILFESRRRHLQRFLILPQLSVALLWLPLIKCILRTQIKPESKVIVTLDRTICLAPGMKLFLTGVTFSKSKGFAQFNLAAYWQRRQQGKTLKLGWFREQVQSPVA